MNEKEIGKEVMREKELEGRQLRVQRQMPVPIIYGGVRFEEEFRADNIVEDKAILELESVEQFNKVHTKQDFMYLKLKGVKLGFALNFGANFINDGIERVVNGFTEENFGTIMIPNK